MATNEQFWNAIVDGVSNLPETAEWYEGDELEKYLRREAAQATVEKRDSLIVSAELIDILGGPDFWDKCRELAARFQCDVLKSKSGSVKFKKRA